jgi:hypothetical protein
MLRVPAVCPAVQVPKGLLPSGECSVLPVLVSMFQLDCCSCTVSSALQTAVWPAGWGLPAWLLACACCTLRSIGRLAAAACLLTRPVSTGIYMHPAQHSWDVCSQQSSSANCLLLCDPAASLQNIYPSGTVCLSILNEVGRWVFCCGSLLD